MAAIALEYGCPNQSDIIAAGAAAGQSPSAIADTRYLLRIDQKTLCYPVSLQKWASVFQRKPLAFAQNELFTFNGTREGISGFTVCPNL